jgi:hypothetical protein
MSAIPVATIADGRDALTGGMQAGMLTIVVIALAGAFAMLCNPIESRSEARHG